MAIYLTEADVENLVDVNDAIGVLEAAFAEWGRGRTANLPIASFTWTGCLS